MITERGTENQNIFVLDSKYYRYSATKNPNHLPDSGSIIKQIAYAEYIDNSDNKNKLPYDIRNYIKTENIYNAFIMPAEINSIEEIGYASCETVLPQNETICEKTYYKIYGILLDIKTLMYKHSSHDKKLINELANTIIMTNN